MKTKKGFRLRELGGDYILIGESVELVNFNNPRIDAYTDGKIEIENTDVKINKKSV